VRAEQHHRQGAHGDGEDAVARAVQQREGPGRGRAEEHERRGAERMQQRGDPRREQRVPAAQQAVFEQPRADLRRSDERARRDRAREARAGRLQEARQMRRHRGAHEPGDGEDEGEQQRREPRRRADAGPLRWLIRTRRLRLRDRRTPDSRQRGVQGQPDREVQRGPAEARAAPA
jgi:hypothetical protein